MDKPFAAYVGQEPYVFVCYAHEDAAAVYPELTRLKDFGVRIWYDEGIPAGANWRQQIGQALEGAVQVLFYISEASITSDHCIREISYALDESKPVIPVRLQDVALPADLKIGLSPVQMIMRQELGTNSYEQMLLAALAPVTGESTSPVSSPMGESVQRSAARVLGGVVALVVILGLAFWGWRELSTAQTTPATVSAIPVETKPSIAVLPFVNMSSDPEQEFFSDGISEELLNLLAKNAQLRVISRSSAFTFKGKEVDIPTVAEQLGVAHVLEGSVRKAGNKVRVTAQLIDARTDTHLWSETYDRELDDIFAIQDEISREVVGALNITLFGAPQVKQARNLEAYTLLLQARHLRATSLPGNVNAAEAMLKEALSIDPNYVEALVELARVYFSKWQISMMPSAQASALALAALEQARVLDPEHAGVYTGLAFHAMYVDRDLASTGNLLERATQLEPNNLAVYSLAGELALNLGRLEDAAGLYEYVTAREPLCGNCFVGLGSIYMLQLKLDKAQRAFTTASMLSSSAESNLASALVLLLQGQHEASLARWQQANPGPFRTYGETITLYSMGRTEAFNAKFDELKTQFGDDYPTMVARVYAWLGDKDKAFAWLDKYQAEHPELGPVIGNFWELLSVELHPLHDDPRWMAHLRKIGIAPEQLAQFDFHVPLPE